MTLKDWSYLAGLGITIIVQLSTVAFVYGKLTEKVSGLGTEMKEVKHDIEKHDVELKDHHGRLAVVENEVKKGGPYRG